MKKSKQILLGLLLVASMMVCTVPRATADSSSAREKLLVSENFNQGKITTKRAIALLPEYLPDDLGGLCLSMGKKPQRLLIPLASHFDPHVGTVEMRIRFTGDVQGLMKKDQYLFRAHTAGHKHGFFLLYGKWAKGLMLFVSDKNAVRTTLRYKNTVHWQSGQWHQIAFTWDMRTPGHAELALYVDYQLAAKKSNLTLPMDWAAWKRLARQEQKSKKTNFLLPTQNLTLGNWGGPGLQPQATLAIDDFRIYGQARHYLRSRIEFKSTSPTVSPVQQE